VSTILVGLDPTTISHIDLDAVRALAPDRRLLVTTDRAEIEAALADIEMAVGALPHDLLPRAHNLRWLQQ